MSGVFVRRKRLIVALAGTLLAAAAMTPVRAENLTVSIDEAQTLKLPEKVSTIIVGNPLIADASLQNGGLLVITGKGFGSTNLMALDRTGKTVMNTTVTVTGPTASSIVVVYKGTARESYSCTPECSPRITLGDDTKFFGDTLGESGSRIGAGAPAK
jgi:hypothetical protein